MRLSHQLLNTTKVCSVPSHPYISAPLYTYEKDSLFSSDLPGNNVTPVSFVIPSSIDNSRHLEASVTPITLEEDRNEVIFAWTPIEPVSITNKVNPSILAERMYDSFIPSFLTQKGIGNWFFNTDITKATKFTRIEDNQAGKTKLKANILYFILQEEEVKQMYVIK